MDGQSHQPATIEAIQLAYHGRKYIRFKVFELRTKRIKKRKRDAKIPILYYIYPYHKHHHHNNHCTNIYDV